MKRFLSLLILACIMLVGPAGAQVHLSGAQEGTLIDTTYVVDDSIYVLLGDSLYIEAGAVLLFSGNFSFRVFGSLFALGEPADSIYVQPDTGVLSWKSLIFQVGSDSLSVVTYCHFTGASGSAINCYQTNITISHCTITGNAASWGGGIYCSTAHPTISECVITNNSSTFNGGGIYCTNSHPTILNCIVTGNACNTGGGGSGMGGGGICCNHNSSPIISGCVISGNHSSQFGGGLSINDNSNPLISECTIGGNTADSSGGGLYITTNSDPQISTCTINGNSSPNNGGGISCSGIQPSYPVISNCTVYGNSAAGSNGGGIYLSNSGATIVNTLVAGNFNARGGVYFAASLDAELSYSDFYDNEGGNFAGSGGPTGLAQLVGLNANGDSCDQYFNIFLDPLLMDPTGGDFHLQAASPCVDAGDPASPLDPDSTVTDIGAYYFDQTAPPPQPQIAVSDSALAFGAVIVGEEATRPLTIFNLGSANLTLRSLVTSAPSFTTDFQAADSVIAPGGSLEIIISFAPLDTITYQDSLTIENNDELVVIGLSGAGMPPEGMSFPSEAMPGHFAVAPPYPNPFNPTTLIRLELPIASFVKLEVCDVKGQRVGVGLDPTRYPAGIHDITFDGGDLPSGIYFYSVRAGEWTATGKILLIK